MTATTCAAACGQNHTHIHPYCRGSFFFFNDTATTEIYTLSLHDALPISGLGGDAVDGDGRSAAPSSAGSGRRSEEHTSELQSQSNLVCRLLLEKKKKNLAARACPP